MRPHKVSQDTCTATLQLLPRQLERCVLPCCGCHTPRRHQPQQRSRYGSQRHAEAKRNHRRRRDVFLPFSPCRDAAFFACRQMRPVMIVVVACLQPYRPPGCRAVRWRGTRVVLLTPGRQTRCQRRCQRYSHNEYSYHAGQLPRREGRSASSYLILFFSDAGPKACCRAVLLRRWHEGRLPELSQRRAVWAFLPVAVTPVSSCFRRERRTKGCGCRATMCLPPAKLTQGVSPPLASRCAGLCHMQ